MQEAQGEVCKDGAQNDQNHTGTKAIHLQHERKAKHTYTCTQVTAQESVHGDGTCVCVCVCVCVVVVLLRGVRVHIVSLRIQKVTVRRINNTQ
jgi:hypothetical protein